MTSWEACISPYIIEMYIYMQNKQMHNINTIYSSFSLDNKCQPSMCSSKCTCMRVYLYVRMCGLDVKALAS